MFAVLGVRETRRLPKTYFPNLVGFVYRASMILINDKFVILKYIILAFVHKCHMEKEEELKEFPF